MKTEVVPDPRPEDRQLVVDRLVAWNLTVAPPEGHRQLLVLSHTGDELVGGLAGHTHWNWLFVRPSYSSHRDPYPEVTPSPTVT